MRGATGRPMRPQARDLMLSGKETKRGEMRLLFVRSCLETADCIFSTCRDCEVCKGITRREVPTRCQKLAFYKCNHSRCPTSPGDNSITLPDWSGNCKCKDQQAQSSLCPQHRSVQGAAAVGDVLLKVASCRVLLVCT